MEPPVTPLAAIPLETELLAHGTGIAPGSPDELITVDATLSDLKVRIQT